MQSTGKSQLRGPWSAPLPGSTHAHSPEGFPLGSRAYSTIPLTYYDTDSW